MNWGNKNIFTHIGVKLQLTPYTRNVTNVCEKEQCVKMKMNMYKSAISMDLLISGTLTNYDVQELGEYDV